MNINHSARRINALAQQLGAHRYLEIGVAAATTFRDIKISERTAVDPNFLFDPNELANEFTRLMPITSDEFFATESIFPPYDIVFIDGLHNFEQVVRDFSNAILRTHRQSVIILDDTIPGDVYSSFQDYRDTMRHRQAAGIDEGSWHGDVFKTVFYLHDFWPSLAYLTIPDSPQTLVWRSNRSGRQPLYNDLERVSRMSYFDLRDHMDVMQLAAEDEAIARCISEIKSL